MKNLQLSSKILVLLLFGTAAIYSAQQTTLPAGNDAQSATGFVSYSIGQIFYEPQQTATGAVNPGVQQAYEIFVLATQETAVPNSITIYPNPVKDFLIVDLSSEKLKKPAYVLFDGTGRLIAKGELKNSKTEINTSALSAGLYLLTVSSERKTIKSFKIIKNK